MDWDESDVRSSNTGHLARFSGMHSDLTRHVFSCTLPPPIEWPPTGKRGGPVKCYSYTGKLLPVFQKVYSLLPNLIQITALLDLTNEDVMSDNSRDPEAERKEQAVIAVQRAWRMYSLKRQQMDADTRWKDAYITARKRVSLGISSQLQSSMISNNCILIPVAP